MKKTKIFLTEAECRLVVHSLNALKTKLQSEGQYTDVVDDVLLKVITASTKRVKTMQTNTFLWGNGYEIRNI